MAESSQFLDEAIRILSRVSYFTGLDSRMLEGIVRDSVLREYDADQLVILEGEPTSGLYVVQDGWLKVSKISLDGREQILQFLGNSDVFNAISIFTGSLHPASVTALELSRVWMIRRARMLQLLESHPPLARKIIQDLSGRVMHLINLVEDLSLRSVEARLARLLLEQSSGNIVFRQRWATQVEIASRIGTVSDVVSRTMRRLVDAGLIEIARKEIRILNRAELERIALIED